MNGPASSPTSWRRPRGWAAAFPVGACLAKEKAARALTPGSHGSTFGGNPLAMAVANAVLDVMLEKGFFERVQKMAQRLRRGLEELLRRHPETFEEVRGAGLLLGLKCRQPNTEMIARLRDAGLLTVGAGDNVVRLLPPLIISEAEVDEGLAILDRVAQASPVVAA